MTTIAPATSTIPSTGEARQTLAQTYDTFLSLLTSQLRNQDPLNPVDSTEFTGQLVSYSMVEQQIATNDTLGNLIQITSASAGSALASYLGQTGEFDTATAASEGGPVEWLWATSEGAETVELSVVDERTGRTVHAQSVAASSEPQSFVWAPPTGQSGQYTLVVNPKDARGEATGSAVRVRAPITGIDFSGTEPRLETGSGVIPFQALLRVGERA